MKEYKLSDFIDVISMGPFGSDIKVDNFKSSGVPVLNGSNLTSHKLVEDSFNYILKEKADTLGKANAYRGDIVITHRGTLGQVSYIPYNSKFERYVISQSQFRVRFNENIDPIYFSYLMKSSYGQKKLFSFKNHVGVPALAQATTNFKNLEIRLHSINEQQKIAAVLSALDDKIEVNNKINAALEAMAKTLYDYWFVQFEFPFDFAQGKPDTEGKPYKSSGGKMVYNPALKREIPEGWEVAKLGDLGNFKNGVNYDPSNPGEVACPIINVRNISSSTYFLKNTDLDVIYLKESDVVKYAVNKDSIIIARSGIPGATRLINDFRENTLYCGFAIHYQLVNTDLKNVIFFYLKTLEQNIKNGSGGTIMKNVNQATLNDLKIALPNNNVVSKFNDSIKPLFEKINNIEKQNQELAQLRDWLLPMLMNGQVTVE